MPGFSLVCQRSTYATAKTGSFGRRRQVLAQKNSLSGAPRRYPETARVCVARMALFPVCCIAVAEWIFAAKTLEEADSQLYWCVTLRPRLAGRTQSLVSDFICRTSPRQLWFPAFSVQL